MSLPDRPLAEHLGQTRALDAPAALFAWTVGARRAYRGETLAVRFLLFIARKALAVGVVFLPAAKRQSRQLQLAAKRQSRQFFSFSHKAAKPPGQPLPSAINKPVAANFSALSFQLQIFPFGAGCRISPKKALYFCGAPGGIKRSVYRPLTTFQLPLEPEEDIYQELVYPRYAGY